MSLERCELQRYLAIFVLFLTYISYIQCLIEFVIPSAKRCWYINHDGGELSYRFMQDMQKLTQSLIVQTERNQSHIDKLSSLTCDSYLFIRQSIEGISNLPEDPDFMRMNNSVIVDTRLILAYEGNDEVSHDEIGKFLNKTIMNVIFLRIPERKKDSRFLEQDNEITELLASALVLDITIFYQRNDPETRSDLEGLFKMQTWDPNMRNGTLIYAYKDDYRPFSDKTIDGNYEGIEYEIIAGLTINWQIELKGFPEFEQESLEYYKGWWPDSQKDDLMVSGRADVLTTGLCIPVSINPETVMRPYTESCTVLIVPKPRPLDPAKYLHLPLTWISWLCFVIAFLVITFIVNRLARFDFGIVISYVPYRQLSYCFITMLDITCGHGFLFPNSTILRTVLLIWMLMSFLVTTFYSTGYSSFLTEQAYSGKITNLEEAIQAGVRWSFTNITDANTFLTMMLWNAEDGSAKQRYAYFTDPFPESQQEIKRRIHDIYYGQFSRKLGRNMLTDLTYSDEDLPKMMEVMKECIQYCPMTFLRAPRSPFRRVLYSRLSAALETGLIEQWMERFVRKEPGMSFDRMLVKEDATLKPLSIGNIRGAFYMLFAGLLLATCRFLAELFCRGRAPQIR